MAQADLQPGLAGAYFNNQDLTDPDQSVDMLMNVAQKWEKSRGTDWAGRWTGFITGPITGEVTFEADVVDNFLLEISGEVVIDQLESIQETTGKFQMEQGRRYPIEISFISRRGKAQLFLYWAFDGQARTIIPGNALSHDASLIPEGLALFDYNSRWSLEDDPPPGNFKAELPSFTGGSPPYADERFHDGGFRPAVGTHNYKVLRANRSHPELVTREIPNFPEAGFQDMGFTYNHQPYIVYWKEHIFVNYLSGPIHEHQEPCYSLITWSKDGRNWVKPRTLFPPRMFPNRKDDGEIQYSITHQRMAFHVSTDGRLLVSSFYGMAGTPNDGQGIGRAIREIYGPDDFGPIYWARYNSYQGFGPENSLHYDFYRKSSDEGFVDAVDEMLADQRLMQQWYEEDPENLDGFYAYAGGKVRYLKAFSSYMRPDGKIVGLWKWRKIAVADSWEPGKISFQGVGSDIYYGGAKIWGQELSDGRFALVYNPVLNTTWRHPLSITTGSDGMEFDSYFLNVHGETPLMRFGGSNKDGGGGQYIRGISPGNGKSPDDGLWLVYSSNKEDIFVTRVPVPIQGTVDRDVDEDFESMEPGGMVGDWNIYSGTWNPVMVVRKEGNQLLSLADEDPYDYAKAVRVFPETTHARISFDLSIEEIGHDNLEIELQNYKGQRPVRIVVVGKDLEIAANEGLEMEEAEGFEIGRRYHVVIEADTVEGRYGLTWDGEAIISDAPFAERLEDSDNPYELKYDHPTVERIVFRTGTYRMRDFSRYGFQANGYRKFEPDLPGADEKVKRSVFTIDNVRTSGR